MYAWIAVAVGGALGSVATFPDNKLRSVIGLVSPTGGQLQMRKIPDQGFTTGSPKLFTINGATFVALHVRTRFDGSPPARQSAVLVYDEQLNLLGRRDVGCGAVVVVGVGPDIFGPIVDFLKKIKELNEFDKSFELPPDPPSIAFGELQPSVAVAHRPDLGPPEEPFIVVVNRMCATVSAFRWRRPDIVRVWENPKGSLPCGLNLPASTSINALSLTPKVATIPPASFRRLLSSRTSGWRK